VLTGGLVRVLRELSDEVLEHVPMSWLDSLSRSFMSAKRPTTRYSSFALASRVMVASKSKRARISPTFSENPFT